MNVLKKSFSLILFAGMVLMGCYVEDPGSLQNGTVTLEATNFNRLEMGNGFDIKVQEGSHFEVIARGDQRNLRDLRARVLSGVLVIDYEHYANRKYQTYITITMPSLRSIDFSGAVYSNISGFEETQLDIFLSGASYCKLEANAENIDLTLSGASSLQLIGSGVALDGNLSGASVLRAFEFPNQSSTVVATGASSAKLLVSSDLKATASGASVIVYRGNPTVDAFTSGGGSVHRE